MSFLENIDIEEIWSGFIEHEHNRGKPTWFNRFTENSLYSFLERYADNAIAQSILCGELLNLWLDLGLITERGMDFYAIKVPTSPHSPST